MKEDLIKDIIDSFSILNRARNFIRFQQFLKGESSFLLKLSELGGESTPTDLAHELEMTGARVTAILHSLELKRLVKRVPVEGDKRKTNVAITPKGKEWLNAGNAEVMQMANAMLDRLGEEDAKELLRLLNKLSGGEKKSEGEGENVPELLAASEEGHAEGNVESSGDDADEKND